jgi:hypothetical protein
LTNAWIIGGQTSAQNNVSSGNALNRQTTGRSVKRVFDFQVLNFEFPVDPATLTEPVLTVTDQAPFYVSDKTVVSVVGVPAGSTVKDGAQIVLIYGTKGLNGTFDPVPGDTINGYPYSLSKATQPGGAVALVLTVESCPTPGGCGTPPPVPPPGPIRSGGAAAIPALNQGALAALSLLLAGLGFVTRRRSATRSE